MPEAKKMPISLWIHLGLILAAVAVVFGGTVAFDFVWDDRILLMDQPVYADFKLDRMLFSCANGLEYLPVRDISYGLDYLFWDSRPFGFHLTNVILYFLNAVFVYLLTLKLGLFFIKSEKNEQTSAIPVIAFATALLFSLHPLHSEAVSFIHCRNVLLSGLFFFAACYAYVGYLQTNRQHTGKYIAALACFALALFSKATTIILPLALLLVSFFHAGTTWKSRRELIPFFMMSAAAFILFEVSASQAHVINEDYTVYLGGYAFSSRLAVAVQIPFFYLDKFFVPLNLSAEYTTPFAHSWTDPAVLLAAAGIVLIAGLLFLLRRRFTPLVFAAGWFIITLIPVLNFFMTHPVVADRYAYLPIYSLCFLMSLAGFRYLCGKRGRWPVIGLVGLILVWGLVWALLAFSRNQAWTDEKRLWEATLRVTPQAPTARANLGVWYFNQGNFQKAFSLLADAKKFAPASLQLEYYQALLAMRRGHPARVITILEPLQAADGGRLNPSFLLGQAYEMTGDLPKAIEAYLSVLKAVEADVGDKKEKARQRLQILRSTKSRQLDLLRRSVDAAPTDLNARTRLALALDRLGLYDEALEHYEQLARQGGDHWALYYNLGNLQKKRGARQAAIRYYQKSLDLNPMNVDAYNNLGLVCKLEKEHDLAIAAFEKAMQIGPEKAFAAFNLAVLYFQLGRRQMARQYFEHVKTRFPYLENRVEQYLSQMPSKMED